jgi:hypothetical protein
MLTHVFNGAHQKSPFSYFEKRAQMKIEVKQGLALPSSDNNQSVRAPC